jgi:hypothetical protein
MGETSVDKNVNSESTDGNDNTECSDTDKSKPELLTVP